jgi:hypothetical protein
MVTASAFNTAVDGDSARTEKVTIIEVLCRRFTQMQTSQPQHCTFVIKPIVTPLTEIYFEERPSRLFQ